MNDLEKLKTIVGESDEIEFLERLFTIKEKMDRGDELTDFELKLFSTIILGVALGLFKHSIELLLDLGIDGKGGDKHE